MLYDLSFETHMGHRSRLGTRVGLVTASNDHQVSRLTGSLPLVQKNLAGFGFMLPFFFS